MNNTKKLKSTILIYDDSAVFGGHEAMAVEFANVLASSYNVAFIYHNETLGHNLNDKVKKINIPFFTSGASLSLLGVRIFDIAKLCRYIKEIKPALTIIAQGGIELCVRGLLASKLAKVRTISYIPLCYSQHHMNLPLGCVRDQINRRWYSLFDGFITISSEQQALLKTVTKNKIYVVQNVVEAELAKNHKNAAKNAVPQIGVIGRIHFAQKGQDKLIPLACQLKKLKTKVEFVIIGEGKDKTNLIDMAEKAGVRDYLKFAGWVDNKLAFYQRLDCSLSLSNYEGVPLTMLESIYMETMMFAPTLPIYAEYLPDYCIYRNLTELSKKIANLSKYTQRYATGSSAIRQKTIAKHDRNHFEVSLNKVIADML